MDKSSTEKMRIIIIGISILIFTIMLMGLTNYFRVMNRQRNIISKNLEEYQFYAAIIAEDADDVFWSKIIEEAMFYGEEKQICVEAFGQDLAVEFSKLEKIEMAIAAKVDAIILEADETQEIKQLINKAVEKDIMVVTVMNDCYGSDRQSFVGIANYNLGREYGRQLIRIATKDTKKVLMLLSSSTDDSSQNIIYTGIQETLLNEGNHLSLEVTMVPIANDTSFSKDEEIRDILSNKENLPDIIICLDASNTTSTYQAIIDYNLVGTVKIIGYENIPSILNAIERDIIYSSIVVDTKEMGQTCIDVVSEYLLTGNTNDYVTLDISVINRNNVKEYLEYAEKNTSDNPTK